jgi:hypothetical protein
MIQQSASYNTPFHMLITPFVQKMVSSDHYAHATMRTVAPTMNE